MTSKPVWASKGIVGGVLALIVSSAPTYGPMLLDLFGVKSPEVQAAIVQAVVGIGGSVAGLLAIWGRGTARSALH